MLCNTDIMHTKSISPICNLKQKSNSHWLGNYTKSQNLKTTKLLKYKYQTGSSLPRVNFILQCKVHHIFKARQLQKEEMLKFVILTLLISH